MTLSLTAWLCLLNRNFIALQNLFQDFLKEMLCVGISSCFVYPMKHIELIVFLSQPVTYRCIRRERENIEAASPSPQADLQTHPPWCHGDRWSCDRCQPIRGQAAKWWPPSDLCATLASVWAASCSRGQQEADQTASVRRQWLLWQLLP